MREITAREITDKVAELFIKANHILGDDVCDCIKCAEAKENTPIAKKVLGRLTDNIAAARELDIPICQDTGMAVVFAELGGDLHITGGTLNEAINAGVAKGYTEGGMRLSVVRDPLYSRKNTENNTPAIIHITTVKGDRLRLVAAPKGFGSENMSALKMFTPSATEDDVVAFVVDTVRRAGSNPCPPVTVGVGIGGDFEYSAILAKRALTRGINDKNSDEKYATLEERLLIEINKLGIGPQGFGGDTTALAVKVEQAPTHIAGLPVAVNINCHVVRHAEAVL